MSLKNVVTTLRFGLSHPQNRGRRLRTLARYVAWQTAVRLAPGPIVVPFVDATSLVIRKQEAATLAVHAGLYDYEEMAFLLHLLRTGDLFVDVGANVGVYTVLASGAAEAQTVAFELVAETAARLRTNLRLNGLEQCVELYQVAVGPEDGGISFTSDKDAENRVLPAAADQERADASTVRVPLARLDTVLGDRAPVALKIDVEGYEGGVIHGAWKTLERQSLLAILVEFVGHGRRYGYDETSLDRQIRQLGYTACNYSPAARTLSSNAGAGPPRTGNTLYVRHRHSVEQRLKTARKFFVHHTATWI